MTRVDDRLEWLETDGAGGFASGTRTGIRTRRYHALLLTATTPPTGRVVLVNGLEAWITTDAGRFALSSHRYRPGVVHPDGASRIVTFDGHPWPSWEFVTPDGARVRHEIFIDRETGATVAAWRLLGGVTRAVLEVRPFLSGRDYHALHHENGAIRFEAIVEDERVQWHPYESLPAVVMQSNGAYTHVPDWYRGFLYDVERERGLDEVEDLASPGVVTWTLDANHTEAVTVWSAHPGEVARVAEGAIGPGPVAETAIGPGPVVTIVDTMRARERARRAAFATVTERAADTYLVRRGAGRTIVAGYPWFTDWGRDTFIALRGLCLATGRLEEARDILLEWSGAVSEGMLPNRFPDAGDAPEFNSVDASLWYVVAVYELLDAADQRPRLVTRPQRARLEAAVQEILTGFASGTRFGIRADEDGLLAAGVAGVQLTWMDARVGDREITPRIGKPVEIQALWLNALRAGARKNRKWNTLFNAGVDAFGRRFWNPERGCLYDVVDVDHVSGTADGALRPNQILAVGGLPFPLVNGDRAARVVDVVERELLTPFGLRSLGPGEPEFAPQYTGTPAERDAVYHQGTVWPWLLGPFVDAWINVRGDSPDTRAEARSRFVAPLMAWAERDGLGHVPEITDATAPFMARGCPFQAWSLGELIRADRRTAIEEPLPASV
jgi:predicted glycogen debranching enzyme